jgi:hypothetical protein
MRLRGCASGHRLIESSIASTSLAASEASNDSTFGGMSWQVPSFPLEKRVSAMVVRDCAPSDALGASESVPSWGKGKRVLPGDANCLLNKRQLLR